MLRQASIVGFMARGGRGPAAVPLSVEEEAFLRAWSRAALTVPRALDADLLAGRGMSLSEYTPLMHLSEAGGPALVRGEPWRPRAPVRAGGGTALRPRE